jgi:hypothetical protein
VHGHGPLYGVAARSVVAWTHCLVKEESVMALYVLRHEHSADACPGAHPDYGPMLLNHVDPSNARERFGVDIHGDAVLRGQHTLYMIVDAADREGLEGFLAPFRQFGSAEAWPSSSCGEVVASGGCAALA